MKTILLSMLLVMACVMSVHATTAPPSAADNLMQILISDDTISDNVYDSFSTAVDKVTVPVVLTGTKVQKQITRPGKQVDIAVEKGPGLTPTKVEKKVVVNRGKAERPRRPRRQARIDRMATPQEESPKPTSASLKPTPAYPIRY